MPGTWSSTAEFNTNSSHPFGTISSLTNDGSNKFTYVLANAHSCETAYNPGDGNYNSKIYASSKDADFTGFKATAKSTASEYYGFAFNINIVNEAWSYYYIVLSDTSFIIFQKINGGTSTKVVDWTQHNAVKASTEENKITVYADKDSTIHILINGTDVYQIKNPVLKQGQIGPVVCLKDTDVTNNVSLTTTYTFTEFQKK